MKSLFLLLLFTFFVLSGCENNPPKPAPNVAQTVAIEPALPQVIFLLDNATAMQKIESHGGSQIETVTDVVASILRKLPEQTHEVSLLNADGCEAKVLLKQHQKNFAVLGSQVMGIKADSNRPLGELLEQSRTLLKQQNTLLLISNGQDNCSGDPCAVAQTLAQQENQKVTIYTVGYQVDDSSKAQLQCIANVTGGEYREAQDSLELDTVVNELIREHVSKAVDHDNDGVANVIDECKDTPQGFSVDKKGCETYYTLKINFPSGSAKIQPQFSHTIKRLVTYLKNNQRKIQLQGHTDSQANTAYNKHLSERRARAVRDQLLNSGINAARLTAVGFGESRPISRNQSNAGRYRNRRVEAHIIK